VNKEPKKLHFMLSPNTLFKEDDCPKVVIEDIGTCLASYYSEEEELAGDEYYYYHHPTLRDISILLYECCGHGVQWQLARELAKELNLDKKDVLIALKNIVHPYAEMDEIEAMKKYHELAVYIKTHDGMPEED